MKSLLSILVIAVSVGVYFVYIKPLTAEVKIQIAKKAEIDKVLNRVKELKDKRDSIFADYNSISTEDIEKLNKIIPETVNTVVVFNDISSVAAQYGLSVTDYKADNNTVDNSAVTDNTTSEPYKKTNLTITMTGPYSRFVEFLQKVESSLRLTDIVQLGIKGDSSAGPGAPLEYTIHATVYSLK